MRISALQHDTSAIDVQFGDAAMRVALSDGREVSAPLEWFPRLRDATDDQRRRWRLIGGGEGIHWTDLDEDVSISSLLGLTS